MTHSGEHDEVAEVPAKVPAEELPPAARPPAERPRPGRLRTGTRLLRAHPRATAAAVTAVALVAASLLLVTRSAAAPGPDDVVRDYLTAVRNRDVPKALRAAGVTSVPGGPTGAFLAAAAIDDGWRVGAVAADPDSARGGTGDGAGREGRSIDVRAMLVDTRQPVAVPPGRYSGTFHLRWSGGRWRIENPFVAVRFGNSPLRFVEVTGVRLPRTTLPAGDLVRDTAPVSQLFPGVYRPYAGAGQLTGGLVTVTSEPLVAMPPLAYYQGAELSYEVTVAPTERLAELVQQKYQDFIRRCLADQAAGRATCSPAISDIDFRTSEGDVPQKDMVSARWTLLRPPAVGLPGVWTVVDSGVGAFISQIAVPGVLGFTGVGKTIQNGRTVSVTQTCLTSRLSQWPGGGFTVGIGADGAPDITWRNPYVLHRRPRTATWFYVTCYAGSPAT